MHHCFRKKTTTAITQCKLQYYIHHMHVHTTTTITTAQLRDNACIQYMRQCFGKKTTSTSISQCKLQYYVQPPPLPCTTTTTTEQITMHPFSICATALGKIPPPPPSHSASYNITANHHYHHHHHLDHHSTNYNACIQYMRHCFRKKTDHQCKLL